METSNRDTYQIHIGLILLGFIVFILSIFIMDIHAVDDAYISFRYAKNFANGDGLVFNPGEKVEGYSNLFWVLLLSPIFKLGGSPVVFSRILGLFFSLGSIFLVWKIISVSQERTGFAVLCAFALIVTNSSFTFWSIRGLETNFYGFLIILVVFCYLSREKRAARICLAPLIFLASITRPEGIIILASFSLYILIRFVVKRIRPDRFEIITVTVALLLFLAFLLWRFHYYGYWFPNTYYAKVRGEFLERISLGWNYLKVFFFHNLSISILAFFTLFRSSQNKTQSETKGLIQVFVLVQIGFIVYVGGDLFFFPKSRFITPYIPVLAVLSGYGFGFMISHIRKIAKGTRKQAVLVSILIPALIIFLAATQIEWGLWKDVLNKPSKINEQVRLFCSEEDWNIPNLGRWLGSRYSTDLFLATGNVGAIPFYSGLKTIDLNRLTDEYLAHHPGKEVEYILERKPDLILFFWNERRPLKYLFDLKFHNNYKFVAETEVLDGGTLLYSRRSQTHSLSAQEMEKLNIEAMTAALNKRPRVKSYLYILAKSYENLGEKKKAKSTYEKILSLKKVHSYDSFWFNLAQAGIDRLD